MQRKSGVLQCQFHNHRQLSTHTDLHDKKLLIIGKNDRIKKLQKLRVPLWLVKKHLEDEEIKSAKYAQIDIK